MNWPDFFYMGGYASYVWSSWGLALLIVLWHLAQAKFTYRRVIKQIKREQQREQLK